MLSVAQGKGHGAENALCLLLSFLPVAFRKHLIVVSPPDSRVRRESLSLGYEWVPWKAGSDTFLSNLCACLKLTFNPGISGASLFFGWGGRAFEWVLFLAKIRHCGVQGRLADHPRAVFHGRFRQWLIRQTASRMDLCVLPSRALERVCREAQWETPACVIYNGIRHFPSKRFSRDGDLVHIGFLGCYALWKGVATVSRWIEMSRESNIRWHLFGGMSFNTRPLVTGAAEKYKESVSYHGSQPADRIYTRLDFVVHPSLDFDPLPNVLIEAAAAGLPVVASDTGGSAEAVTDGKTGFLYPPRNPEAGYAKLRLLAENEELRQRMGEAAKAMVKKRFSPIRMADEYLALWKAIPNVPAS